VLCIYDLKENLDKSSVEKKVQKIKDEKQSKLTVLLKKTDGLMKEKTNNVSQEKIKLEVSFELKNAIFFYC
jgi:hypothetical protein